LNQIDLPVAVIAADAQPRTKPSIYPEPFASMIRVLEKRPLGDHFGLTNFGVTLARVVPGAVSTLRNAHATRDELIYVLERRPTLITVRARPNRHPARVRVSKQALAMPISSFTDSIKMFSI
jgi:uncharacterized cupin superfamily protein